MLAGFRRGRLLTLPEPMRAAENAELLKAGAEREVASHEVPALAAASHRSAYDCEFVAAAQQLGLPSVTSHEAILRAFPSTAISPETFCG